MAGKVFVIGDTHFGHKKIFTFSPSRKVLSARENIYEHNQELIRRWNSVVDNKDVVYHLGDIAVNKDYYEATVPQLNGIKYLVRGNHDLLSDDTYRTDFNKILGPVKHSYKGNKFWITHIPIHPQEFYGYKLNIHGHVHENDIMLPFNPATDVKQELDLRYFNASCERIDFTPTLLNDIIDERLKLIEESK